MHLIALVLLAAPAAPAPAATPPSVAVVDAAFPAKGIAGVSFGVLAASTPTVGAQYFLSNDVAVRGDFSLFAPITPGGPGQNTYISVSAGLRSYQLKHEHVAVFLQPVVGIGREQSPAATDAAALFLRFGAGIGVEYFFTPRFSVGAILELSLKLADIAGPAGNPVYTTLSTDTSSLSANIYF